MKPFSRDTDAAAHRVQVELLRKRSPAERVGLAQRARAAANAMALARLRRQHPEDDDRTRRLRLAALWYGPELVEKAFGWTAETSG